ncbi:MAG: FAD-binding protein, partial [Ilumatobacteraceae bacterium]
MKANWQNWAKNQRSNGVAFHRPSNESELASIVNMARQSNKRVKVVGHGHSFTDIAVTDGHIVSLENFNKILRVDTADHEVTVEAGIQLSDLNDKLDAIGYAMPNLGDIAYQSLAGSLSTSTHGTGVRLPGLAAQVVHFRLVTADGSILNCSEEENSEIFHVGRVGLGAVGILSSVTIRVVPAFRLHAIEEPMRLDYVLEHLEHLVGSNNHFE